MKKVLFIINILLQKKSGKVLPKLISDTIDKRQFEFDIRFSEFPGQANEIAVSARENYDIIVAAGGDGTVNEVARAIAGTGKVYGIIPIGSGNGLARTMKIPLKVSQAIQIIYEGEISTLDMGRINGIPFFNMAGVGFDASVAHAYNQRKRRGFLSYLGSVAALFFHYKSRWFEIKHNSEVNKVQAFLISFANTSQWGYNAHICPGADPSDGLLGITILRSFPKIIIPVLAWRLFTGKLHKSKYVRILMAKRIEICAQGEIAGHVDGNPVIFNNHIQVEISHNSVHIIRGCN